MVKWLSLCCLALSFSTTSAVASDINDAISGVERFVVGADSVLVTKSYRTLFGVDLFAGSARTAAKAEQLSIKIGESFTVADRSLTPTTYTVSRIEGDVAVLDEVHWRRFDSDAREAYGLRTRRIATYGATMPTFEQRADFVKRVRSLENSPLGEISSEDHMALFRTASNIVLVPVCSEIVEPKSSVVYPHFMEVTSGFLYAAAAYSVEHPDQAKNSVAVGLAGVEGALRQYTALLKAMPDAQSPTLDRLAEEQKHGTLAQHVAEATKHCR